MSKSFEDGEKELFFGQDCFDAPVYFNPLIHYATRSSRILEGNFSFANSSFVQQRASEQEGKTEEWKGVGRQEDIYHYYTLFS